MLPRQPLCPPERKARAMPRCWLMTDARLGQAMPAIIAAMPPRSGIIIRPYALAPEGRAAMICAIRRIGRAKRHMLLIAARDTRGFDGRHGGGPAARFVRHPINNRPSGGCLSMPVHDAREAARAKQLRADLLFISPVWPTQSHGGAETLGRRGFARLARASKGAAAIALGGMTAARFHALRNQGAAGWAAIDAWSD